MKTPRTRHSPTGTAAAALAGAAAVWVMDRFDWFVFDHMVDADARSRTEAVRPGGWDPAEALASKVASAIGAPLGPAPPHRHPAGLAVHYAVPMALAVAYAALRGRVAAVGRGRGALFGAATFVALDEIVNPLLGLAAAPTRYPWQRHARELAAHVLWGVVMHAGLDALGRASARRRA